ncbi:MAG: hypothetical protein J6Y94_07300 [Bacteriovoracaceae bacterium]|nr:hypothetical protein [Bacteriovoracaceae bacterium]
MATRSIFRDVLRLLTVEEVEELTTITEVEDMYSLTELVKEYICSFYVAPIVQKIPSLTTPTGEVGTTATSASSISSSQEKVAPKSVAEFIFQEKEKFKKFNQQSKKQKSVEIYRHTLAHGRRTSSANDKDVSSTVGTGKGTLINRRVG